MASKFNRQLVYNNNQKYMQTNTETRSMDDLVERLLKLKEKINNLLVHL